MVPGYSPFGLCVLSAPLHTANAVNKADSPIAGTDTGTDTFLGQTRAADNPPLRIDGSRGAEIPAQSPEVLHHSLVVYEGVLFTIGRPRATDDLPAVIEAEGQAGRAAERAQVSDHAVRQKRHGPHGSHWIFRIRVVHSADDRPELLIANAWLKA